MEEPFVHKIFTGKVQQIDGEPNATDPMAQSWETSIFKNKIGELIWLGKQGLFGDETDSKRTEERIEKALFAYPIKHYKYLKEELNVSSLELGAVGENLSVLEMDEYTVCIGDTYQFGDAIIQVSLPSQPNWKVARRFKKIDLAQKLQDSGRTGWYFRVLKEGQVLSRIDLELIDRPHPHWSVAACNEVMHVYKDDLRLADELASCELLSINWKKILQARLRGQTISEAKRLFGPNKS